MIMKTIEIKPFFFEFESDFVDTLKCVPMIVRYKLDTCGIKLKLHEWAKLSFQHKESLTNMPCHQPYEIVLYKNMLCDLIRKQFGYEAGELSEIQDSWNFIDHIPDEVQEKAKTWTGMPIALKDWILLDTLQRFALVKLSRSGHEGSNFPGALKEFGL
jgi:hypothetical protein